MSNTRLKLTARVRLWNESFFSAPQLKRISLGGTETPVLVKSCIPVIPSADLEKSLRFWVEALGLTMDRAMRHGGKLIGCMVHNEHVQFWLNQRAGDPAPPENYEGLRLYWAPTNIRALRDRLQSLGYVVSELNDREYGQTEFFVTDDDGYSHCFGIATEKVART